VWNRLPPALHDSRCSGDDWRLSLSDIGEQHPALLWRFYDAATTHLPMSRLSYFLVYAGSVSCRCKQHVGKTVTERVEFCLFLWLGVDYWTWRDEKMLVALPSKSADKCGVIIGCRVEASGVHITHVAHHAQPSSNAHWHKTYLFDTYVMSSTSAFGQLVFYIFVFVVVISSSSSFSQNKKIKK